MCVLILVPSERRLAERVFASLAPFAEQAAAAAAHPAVLRLLSFAGAVARSSASPERLFRLIDLYEAVRPLLPEFERGSQINTILLSEASLVFDALAVSIRAVFMELENLIRRDPAKTAIPGGGLHPITRYVCNYLRAALASRATLEEVMEDSSSLAVQVAWIMDVLQTNLDGKSKIYREQALSSIFLMNNGKYVVQKVKDSELMGLLGEEWLRKQNSMIRRWGSDYQRLSWSRVVSVLRMDGVQSNSASTGKVMIERLRKFNADLDENWRVQGAWVVVDEQLRSELRYAVQEIVSPAYRNFIARIRQMPDVGKQLERYMKFSPEEVDARINELFEGNGRKA